MHNFSSVGHFALAVGHDIPLPRRPSGPVDFLELCDHFVGAQSASDCSPQNHLERNVFRLNRLGIPDLV